MFKKSTILLSVTLLSIMVANQAQASQFIVSSVTVQSSCNFHHPTTLKQQHLPSLCSQAREENQDLDTGRPPRD